MTWVRMDRGLSGPVGEGLKIRATRVARPAFSIGGQVLNRREGALSDNQSVSALWNVILNGHCKCPENVTVCRSVSSSVGLVGFSPLAPPGGSEHHFRALQSV